MTRLTTKRIAPGFYQHADITGVVWNIQSLLDPTDGSTWWVWVNSDDDRDGGADWFSTKREALEALADRIANSHEYA